MLDEIPLDDPKYQEWVAFIFSEKDTFENANDYFAKYSKHIIDYNQLRGRVLNLFKQATNQIPVDPNEVTPGGGDVLP